MRFHSYSHSEYTSCVYYKYNCDSSHSIFDNWNTHAPKSPKSRKHIVVYKCAVVYNVFVFSTNHRRVSIRQLKRKETESEVQFIYICIYIYQISFLYRKFILSIERNRIHLHWTRISREKRIISETICKFSSNGERNLRVLFIESCRGE